MDDRKIAVLGHTRHGKTAAILDIETHKAYAEGDAALVEHMKRMTVCPSSYDGIPNHLSIDRASRYYSPCGAYIGVEIDGQDVTGLVVEYDVREGWVRITDAPRGTKLSHYQVTSAQKRYGVVETFWARQPNRQIRRQLARVPA